MRLRPASISATVPVRLPRPPSCTSALVRQTVRFCPNAATAKSAAITKIVRMFLMEASCKLRRRKSAASHVLPRGNHLPGDPALADDAIVAGENQAGQEVFDRRGSLAAKGDQRRRLEIEVEKIGRLARLETAALPLQRQRA